MLRLGFCNLLKTDHITWPSVEIYVRSTCVCSLQTSAEMFSEVVLSNALNKLRGGPFGDSDNMCTTFVETKAYDIWCSFLIPFRFVLIFEEPLSFHMWWLECSRFFQNRRSYGERICPLQLANYTTITKFYTVQEVYVEDFPDREKRCSPTWQWRWYLCHWKVSTSNSKLRDLIFITADCSISFLTDQRTGRLV